MRTGNDAQRIVHEIWAVYIVDTGVACAHPERCSQNLEEIIDEN